MRHHCRLLHRVRGKSGDVAPSWGTQRKIEELKAQVEDLRKRLN